MKVHPLGNSGLKISQITLGTNNFGSQVPEPVCLKIINEAFDHGVNSIDTANVYTNGKSEEIIGRAIYGRRDDFVIATKVGKEGDPLGFKNDAGLSRKNILRQLENSLSRLQTTYVDLYYAHCFDPTTPLEETLRTLDALVNEGKIRYFACSNFSSNEMSQALEISERLGLETFIANQCRYNLIQREVETDLLPICNERRVGFLAYNPLRGGLLAGRYESSDRPPLEGTRGHFRIEYWNSVNNESNFHKLSEIKRIARDAGIKSLPKLAISWLLQNGVSSVVAGASRPEQFAESCEAPDMRIEPEIKSKLDALN